MTSTSSEPFVPKEVSDVIGDILGEVLTPALLMDIQSKLAAKSYLVRHLSPNQAFTMEYRPNRLNLSTNSDNEIVRMRMG